MTGLLRKGGQRGLARCRKCSVVLAVCQYPEAGQPRELGCTCSLQSPAVLCCPGPPGARLKSTGLEQWGVTRAPLGTLCLPSYRRFTFLWSRAVVTVVQRLPFNQPPP